MGGVGSGNEEKAATITATAKTTKSNNNNSSLKILLAEEGRDLQPNPFHLQLPPHHRTER